MTAISGIRIPSAARRRARGFTLPEVLVAVLVGLLVLAGVHRVFVAGLTTQTTTSLQTEVNRKAQVGMDDIIMRLRGGSSVVDAQADRIHFVDQNENNCRYWVEEGQLRRYCAAAAGAYSGGIRVASDITQLQFDYFNRDGQPAATADETARAEVTLEVTKQGQNALLRSAVRLRNK